MRSGHSARGTFDRFLIELTKYGLADRLFILARQLPTLKVRLICDNICIDTNALGCIQPVFGTHIDGLKLIKGCMIDARSTPVHRWREGWF